MASHDDSTINIIEVIIIIIINDLKRKRPSVCLVMTLAALTAVRMDIVRI